MSDVYWVWRNVARWVRSALDLATRGLRGRSPNRLGLNLSVDHEDRTPTHGYEPTRGATKSWRRECPTHRPGTLIACQASHRALVTVEQVVRELIIDAFT